MTLRKAIGIGACVAAFGSLAGCVVVPDGPSYSSYPEPTYPAYPAYGYGRVQPYILPPPVVIMPPYRGGHYRSYGNGHGHHGGYRGYR